MDPATIAILIKDIGLPLIMTAIRAHQNATNGQMPTEAQILAALPADARYYDSIGQAWLAAQKKP